MPANFFATARGLWVAGWIVAMLPAACQQRLEPLSEEQATIERAAIHEDLRADANELYFIAAKNVRTSKPELRDRHVVCAIASADIQFVSDFRAHYLVSYSCGIAPWKPGQSPVGTTTLSLDLLKEHGRWMINGFM